MAKKTEQNTSEFDYTFEIVTDHGGTHTFTLPDTRQQRTQPQTISTEDYKLIQEITAEKPFSNIKLNVLANPEETFFSNDGLAGNARTTLEQNQFRITLAYSGKGDLTTFWQEFNKRSDELRQKKSQ